MKKGVYTHLIEDEECLPPFDSFSGKSLSNLNRRPMMRTTYKFTGLSDVDVQTATLRHNLELMELRVESTTMWRLMYSLFGERPTQVEEEEGKYIHNNALLVWGLLYD